MITLVTINLNNADGLKKTIESVINQTKFNEIEYIVKDGGSSDGSVDIIKQYEDKIDFWISEKDDGIYNAFNYTIPKINGEYVLFLNSGDYLYSNDVIERCMPYLGDNYGIVYGDEYKARTNGTRYLAKYPDKLDESFFRRTALPHQSLFAKSSLLKQHHYSEEYKLLGDWMWLRERIMEDKVSYKHIPIPISVYGLDGMSSVGMATVNEEKKNYYKKISQ